MSHPRDETATQDSTSYPKQPAQNSRSHAMLPHQVAPYLTRLLLVFVAYSIGGTLGLAVPFTNGNVSPVWPPAGIALAAILFWGYGMWPGIALGAFLVNLFTA